jgi:hypothetical protein
MFRSLRQLIPSPAMIVALVALVMSLGGSAYATLMAGESSPPIPGEEIKNNSVTGEEIKNNSVTSKEIKNNSVTSKEIHNNSVTGKDVRRRSLRGRDLHKNSVGWRAIKERSLKTVPSARRARGLDLWAIVGPNGGVQGGRGVVRSNPPPSAVRTSAAKPATVRRAAADQVVTFTKNVSKCSVLATIGSSNSSFPAKYGQIMVAHDTNPNAVKVRTEVMPFQVGVICP